MRMLNYNKWRKRNLLVLKMIDNFHFLEDKLSTMNIPFKLYDCTDQNTDVLKLWRTDKELISDIIISGGKTKLLVFIIKKNKNGVCSFTLRRIILAK